MLLEHKDTKVHHTVSKEEYEQLQASGHAANFKVLDAEDFQPGELTIPSTKPKVASPTKEVKPEALKE